MSHTSKMATVDWLDLVKTNMDLFKRKQTRCLLLQTSSTVLTDDNIRDYFKKQQSAEIEHIFHLPDGILLVLDNEEAVTNIFLKKNIQIANVEIKIFYKHIPKFCNDRLLLEGSFDDMDSVRELLHCYVDDAEISITLLRTLNYSVKFSRSIDVWKIVQDIASTDLPEIKPTAYPVCRTDCLLVSNLVKNVKKSAIKLAFKKIGGEVTKVEKMINDTDAIVYFADYRCAENFAERGKTKAVLVGQNPIKVQLHFRNLTDVVESSDPDSSVHFLDLSELDEKNLLVTPEIKTKKVRKKANQGLLRGDQEDHVKKFQTWLPVDQDVVLFSQKWKKGLEPLRDQLTGLADLADVGLPSKSSFTKQEPSFIFRPCQDLSPEFNLSQQMFEEKCMEIATNFFDKFTSESMQFEHTSLLKLRHSMNWNEDGEIIDVRVTEEQLITVLVRWSEREEGHVKVTGTIDDVSAMKDFLELNCNDEIETAIVYDHSFRAILEINIVEEVKRSLQGKVEIRTEWKKEDDSGKIILKGTRRNVEEAKSKMIAELLEVETEPIQEAGCRWKYLLSALKDKNRGADPTVDVRQFIQDEFKKRSISASIQRKPGEVCVKYYKSDERDKAKKALSEIISQKSIVIKEGFDDVIHTPQWIRLKEVLEAPGNVQVYYNESESSVDVVGLTQEFSKAFKQVDTYVKKNAIITKIFRKHWVIIKYLEEHIRSEKDFAKISKNVKLEFVIKDVDGLITVKGKKNDVAAAHWWLRDITRSLTIKEQTVCEPGVSALFRSQKGRQEIETISKTNRCIGTVDAEDLKIGARNENAWLLVQSVCLIVIPFAVPWMLYYINKISWQFLLATLIYYIQKWIYKWNKGALTACDKTNTPIQVTVEQGDITTTTCDGIVNTTMEFLLTGTVGEALEAKAGQNMVEELENPQISSTDNIRVTTGGKLCQYILHLNTPSDINKLESVLRECFCEASKLGIKHLAIPAVGTGGIGLQSGQVAKCIASAIEKFGNKKKIKLKKIQVYVFRKNMLPDFQRELSTLVSRSKAVPTKVPTTDYQQMSNKMSSIIPMKTCYPKQTSVRITFCSWFSADVDKAFKAVQNIVGDNITKCIENEAIELLTKEEELELLSVIKKENVSIQKTSNTELSIKGWRQNVLEASVKATNIISLVQKAMQSSRRVRWEYMDPETNHMIQFPLRVNFQLEKSWKKHESRTARATSAENGVDNDFQVDFTLMEATNLSTNTTSKIMRTILDYFTAYWKNMEGEAWKRVTVLPTTSEYQTIITKFSASTTSNLIKLERIQNPTLWQQYQSQKHKIEAKISNQSVTRELFHGTAGDICDLICKDAFDRSHAQENGAFGSGVYFATESKYSEAYSPPDTQGHKSMLLAEVVTGNYCKGNRNTVKVPMQNDGTPFDSVVDDINNPTIFVVFRDASAYPKYLLTFA